MNARQRQSMMSRHQTAAGMLLWATPVCPPGTWRYKVEELHPTCRATSTADIVPAASIALAALTLMAFSAGGRPPTRPRARLAASAVRVRSRKSSTSNCPRAAKIWRISRPVALVVLMFSCSDRRPMPREVKLSTVDRSWRAVCCVPTLVQQFLDRTLKLRRPTNERY